MAAPHRRELDDDLLGAVRAGDADAVEAAIRAGGDPNARERDNNRRPALVTACRAGHEAVAAALLAAGADVDQTDQYSVTALHAACERGFGEVIGLLLRHRANVDPVAKFTSTPLHTAASQRHAVVVEALLDAGANVNAVDHSHGWTPLHAAAGSGDPETRIVAALLEARADLEARDDFGLAPLHCACFAGAPSAALLLDAKADINMGGYHGQVPLAYAATEGHAEVVALLLRRQASVDGCGADGTTPLFNASRRGRLEVVVLLLEAGASVASVDSGGRALHLAATGGHAAVVDRLLAAGADPAASNGNGETAADLAFRYNYGHLGSSIAEHIRA